MNIKQILTWWNGQTLGTWLYTRRHGVLVGSDSQGNVYYKHKTEDRRWVIYNGESEASRIPPEWHLWIHHTVDSPPTESPLPAQIWEQPHRPNLTGAAEAYAPPSSLLRVQFPNTPQAKGDYEAWTPPKDGL